MARLSHSWRQRVFSVIMFGCVLFVVLTLVAMPFYPGGTSADHTASGYSFFSNFFSDLGLTETRTGHPNTVSAILFFTAMVMGGAGLVLFFMAFPQFFTKSKSGRLLSRIGSIFGVISAVCFIGIGFTPANLYKEAHMAFVMWAFQILPLAVILYAVAILREPDYPNRYGFVFVAFAVLLVLYVALIITGPARDSPEGLMIQVTGQKAIVYAIIISIFIQAYGARKLIQGGQRRTTSASGAPT